MMKRHAWVLVVATLLLSLTGCWERLSWSPNGRYLAFIGPDDGAIWLWDTRGGRGITARGRCFAERLALPVFSAIGDLSTSRSGKAVATSGTFGCAGDESGEPNLSR